MEIRPHNAQHDRIGDLPRISEAATVTRVEELDEHRGGEVRVALADLLARRDLGDPDAIIDGRSIDWDRVATALDERDAPSRIRRRVDALRERYARETPSLLRVGFRTEEVFDFVAGQYVTIRYRGRARAYSLASSPNAMEAELCVRRVPDGHLSPLLCEELSVGDELSVRGPHGEFALADAPGRDLVFLATGTGVAPFRSMIDYVFEEDLHLDRDVWLFLGAAWRDDLPYRGAFRDLADEHDDFHFVPTCTRERYLTNWDGESDYVQRTLMKYLDDGALEGADLPRELRSAAGAAPAADVDARLDPDLMEVYACGSNAMVADLADAVEAIGVRERHCHLEGFG